MGLFFCNGPGCSASAEGLDDEEPKGWRWFFTLEGGGAADSPHEGGEPGCGGQFVVCPNCIPEHGYVEPAQTDPGEELPDGL